MKLKGWKRLDEFDANEVVTSGCWDLFHVGHYRHLKKASRYAGILTVMVYSDRLIKEYKGKLPVVGQKERQEIISSLLFVQRTHLVESRDLTNHILWYHTNVLATGSGWGKGWIYASAEKAIKRNGGKVVKIPYTKWISSSMIRRNL